MNIPAHLRYTPHHLWVELQTDGSALAGITDHAQGTLGDIVYVEAPAAGTTINAGQPCGIIESVKTASDLHAPLSGAITGVNGQLQEMPEQINDAPYAAWIFRVRPDTPGELANLLDAEGYRRLLEQG